MALSKITSKSIEDGIISADDLAAGSVSGAKLATPLDLSATVITAPKIANGGFIADANGNEQIKFTTTASAVNELTVTNNATGSAPIISATGGDTNISIALTPKGTGGIVLPAGAVGTPALTTSGDTNTGIFFPTADTIAFTEGGTEAMRIDSNGNVGIGVTSPVTTGARFSVKATGDYDAGIAIGSNSSANNWARLDFKNTNFASPSIIYQDQSGNFSIRTDGAVPILFETNATERMRIASTGAVSTNATGAIPLTVNRLTDDGILVNLQQDTNSEGNISVSGATVAFNGFTGSHWSRFIDSSKPDVLRGTVMETLDQMTDWYNAEFTDSENNLQKKPYALKANEQEGDVITYNWNTDKKDEDDNDIIEQVQATIVKQVDVKHVMSKISDTAEAKNVYGVFHAWDNDDLINNDFYVASCGSYVVRIKAGQTVSKGDLLQSNGDGTAKVQADDIIRASTFAKVLSNTVIDTYEDGSFIVPCSLMC